MTNNQKGIWLMIAAVVASVWCWPDSVAHTAPRRVSTRWRFFTGHA
jgi:hypothetical protein